MSLSQGDAPEHVTLNRHRFLDKLSIPEKDLAQAVQIGRDGIAFVQTPGKYSDCDALISRTKGIFLSILTADCAPVLIWSTEEPVVAAVHSGWNGSELDILGQTIQSLIDAFNVSPRSLYLVIGPGLTQENFEVGTEFKEKFPLEYLEPDPETGQFYFDNNRFLKDSAVKRGVFASHIEILDYCTYRDENLFFSHRRDKGVTGRMMSVIGINN